MSDVPQIKVVMQRILFVIVQKKFTIFLVKFFKFISLKSITYVNIIRTHLLVYVAGLLVKVLYAISFKSFSMKQNIF